MEINQTKKKKDKKTEASLIQGSFFFSEDGSEYMIFAGNECFKCFLKWKKHLYLIRIACFV